MKIVVLSDNKQLLGELENEHGLSVYLETENYKCLLDTGASDMFIRNAEKTGINLEDIDYVFISHGHSDHTGGLQAFLEINRKAKIVLSKYVLSQRFFSIRNGVHEISSKIDISHYEDRFIFIDEITKFENDIFVFPCRQEIYPLPKANSTIMTKKNNGLKADNFDHEIIVCIGVDDLFVYTGCAHHGVLNILNSVQSNTGKHISTLIGGFHLLDGYPDQYESVEEITEIAESLATNYPGTMIYTGHCTGDNVYRQLKKTLKDNLNLFYTGFTLFIHKS